MTHSHGGDGKTRTAVIAATANVILTSVKFALYYFSGSMAILAEAWHSFADIATSVLVLIAVLASRKSDPEDVHVGKLELFSSLLIGIMLLTVSLNLGWRCFSSQPGKIDNALVAGLIFIAFSTGSYMVSVIETRVGRKEGSPGLLADGMHARADMTASLLTGISLIIYHMGLNIDRAAAGIIAFFIFVFALETIINAALAFKSRDEDTLFGYRSFRIISFVTDREQLAAALGHLCAFTGRIFPAGWVRKAAKGLLYGLILLAVSAYLSTAFISVGVNEQAIIERLGRPVSLDKPLQPGLHLKLPWPFDRAMRVDVTSIRSMNIGNTGDCDAKALLWTKDHGSEYAFISGDDTIFYPSIILHYRIKNIAEYLYNNYDGVELANQLAHRIATELFARVSFNDVTVVKRSALEQEILKSMQCELDALHSGIEILNVSFKDIHPPIMVAGSFEEVIAGYQEKQRIINNAHAYRNKVLPKARGEAVTSLEKARAYITDRRLRSQGDSERFVMAQPSTAMQRRAAKSHTYFQVMQNSLKHKTIYILDPNATDIEIWMDFDFEND